MNICTNTDSTSIDQMQILSLNRRGAWQLNLPPALKAHQDELEGLLQKVFAGRAIVAKNLALAQQMSLNWCTLKYRQMGIPYHSDLSSAISVSVSASASVK